MTAADEQLYYFFWPLRRWGEKREQILNAFFEPLQRQVVCE